MKQALRIFAAAVLCCLSPILIHAQDDSVDFIASGLSQGVDILYSNLPYSIGFSAEVRGNMSIDLLKIGFYLSEDLSIGPDDLLLGEYITSNPDTAVLWWDFVYIDSVDYSAWEERAYYLIVAVDHDNSYEEIDEGNNQFISQVFLNKSYVMPENLGFQLLEPSSDTVRSGSKLAISIAYMPEEISQQVKLEAYLSVDSLVSEDDMLLLTNYDYVNSFQKKTYSKDILIQIDEEAGMTAGTYYIIAVLDPDKQIQERNEEDNFIHHSIYISTETRHDLKVSNVRILRDSVLSNHFITMTCTLENKGNMDIDQGRLYLYLSEDSSYSVDDRFVGTGNFPYLMPGESFEVNVSTGMDNDLPTGAQYLIVRADTLNQYLEINESNNEASAAIFILDPEAINIYDLEALEVLAPDTVYLGDNVPFSVKYIFHNSVRSSVNFAAYLSRDSILGLEDLSSRIYQDGFYSYAMMESSKTFYYHSTTNHSTGLFYLIFKGDDYNHMNEDNEDNNIVFKPVYFLPKVFNESDIELDLFELHSQIIARDGKIGGNLGIRCVNFLTADTAYVDFYISAAGSETKYLLGTDTSYIVNSNFHLKSFSFQIPGSFEPGAYTFSAMARPQAYLVDNFLQNNFDEFNIAIVESDVDYLIEDMQAITPTVYTGGLLAYTLKMRNAGTSGPTTTLISYFISEDPVYSAEDLLIHETSTGELGIQNTQFLKRDVYIPSETVPGNYYLIAVLDEDQAVNESDETNNSLSIAFEVLKSGPNLVIDRAQMESSELVKDLTYSISLTVKNTGNAYAGSSYAGFYLSSDAEYDETDRDLGGRSIYSLSSGRDQSTTGSFTIPKDIEAGSYQLLVRADRFNAVDESNEDDNIYAIPVTISNPEVDLEVSGTNISDTLKILQGTNAQLNVTVTNNGEHGYTGDIQIYAYISSDSVFDPFSDIFAGSQELRTVVSPGSSASEYLTCYFPDWLVFEECWTFLFVDALNKVQETNEENNAYGIPTKFTESDADLVFSEFSISPDSIPSKTRINYNFKVRNQGSTLTNHHTTRIEFFWSVDSILDPTDPMIRYFTYGTVDAQAEVGTSTDAYLPYYFNSGKYYLIGSIDPGNYVLETDDSNNYISKAFWVIPTDVDLWITYLSLDKESGLPGQRIEGDYAVINSGEDGETATFRSKIYFSKDTLLDASDTYLLYDRFYGLPRHTSSSNPISFFVPQVEPGRYYILAIADSENNSPETNEDNNSAYIPFYVTSEGDAPDYSIENVEMGQDLESGAITVGCVIRNQGSLDGGAPTDCKFFLSMDEEIQYNDYLFKTEEVADLSAESEIELYAEGTVPEGNYNYLIIIVDQDEHTRDKNRSNNIYTKAIVKEQPYDLILESQIITTEVKPGETVRFESMIERQGERYYDSVSIAYYISRDSILEFLAEPRILKMIQLSTDTYTEDSFDYVMPETVETGTYYGIVALAWDTIWMEAVSSNNFAFLPFEVVEKTSASGGLMDSWSTELYPIPASEFVLVRSSVEMESYRLTDLRGTILKEEVLRSEEARIDVGVLVPGVYLLWLQRGSDQLVRKLIVD